MAYGDNRQVVASDTFDTSISASWENGGGDWGTWTHAGSGQVNPTAEDTDSALRRNNETFANDQWSQIAIGGIVTDNGIYTGAACRMQAGTDESSYVGYSESFVGSYEIYELTSAFGFSLLASTGTGWAILGVGNTLTLELEGTTIRLGDDRGADTQRLTTTDATLTSGTPGFAGYIGTTANILVTSWTGGDIAAAGTAFIKMVGNNFRLAGAGGLAS
jgi:hypothetical protein